MVVTAAVIMVAALTEHLSFVRHLWVLDVKNHIYSLNSSCEAGYVTIFMVSMRRFEPQRC